MPGHETSFTYDTNTSVEESFAPSPPNLPGNIFSFFDVSIFSDSFTLDRLIELRPISPLTDTGGTVDLISVSDPYYVVSR